MSIATATAGPTEPHDVGYYAIKGFLYQFDKTLIEILQNPQAVVAFENQQDIDYEDHVLQVQNKGTQIYAPSKIRKPVQGLLELFSRDPTKRLCLYCHFRNKTPADLRLSLSELDDILGDEAKHSYNQSTRQKFLSSFVIRFSEDYEAQFRRLLDLLQSSFSLSANDEAALYHSIFRSKLMDLSLRQRPERRVSLQDLKAFLDDAHVIVFQSAYSKYMGADRYARLVRKRYFTFSAPNIENFERLFLVECDTATSEVDLIEVAARTSRKFFRKGKSPQPYLIFRKLPDNALNYVKRALLDQGIVFFDGTRFNGDKFRPDELAKNHLSDSSFTLKVARERDLESLIQRVTPKEVFQFFLAEPVDLALSARHCRIQIDKVAQVVQMIS